VRDVSDVGQRLQSRCRDSSVRAGWKRSQQAIEGDNRRRTIAITRVSDSCIETTRDRLLPRPEFIGKLSKRDFAAADSSAINRFFSE